MKKSIELLLMLIFSINIFAQVGINTDEPNPNTALHISERMKSNTPDADNKIKGIIIPRLTQQERDKLTYSDTPANSVVRLNAFDNSLMIFNTTENCYNFWNTAENTWKSVCGNLGNASFTFNCTDVLLKGTYIKGKETDSSNYIAISVNVTKSGSYLLTATSATNNGYSFVGQGTFTTIGIQTVKLYAQGTPIIAEVDTFTIKSTGSVTQEACSILVNVQQDIATYSLNCSSIVVNGTYLKGNNLTSANNITLNVNVSATGSYNFSTAITNGISFSASGTFTSTGTQQISLLGTGTPTVNTDFNITINSNTTSGTTTCNAMIPVMLPAMTYAVIGANNDYTFHPNGVRAKAFNNTSFGPAGKVKIVSLTNLWNTDNVSTAITNINGATKPDIIIYFSYGITPTTALADSLSNYVNAGGVLIFGTRDGQAAEANIILNGIFGQSNAQTQISGTGSVDDNVYPISNLPSDPIINGPFGNAAGQYWGEDNSSTGTIVVTSLPANSIQIASANNPFSKTTVNPAFSTVWYNNSKNFVYFGDSVGAAENNLSLTDYPSLYNNGIPLTKRYGQFPNQDTQAQYVYNAILELNAISWGIKKAANSGINPH